MFQKAKILLADDHRFLTEAMTRFLEPDFELVGTARDGRELLEKMSTACPDIVVLDISMPNLNGIEAARAIRKGHPAVKLVFLSMHSERAYVRGALQVGASAYLTKSAAASELTDAINEVLSGGTYLTHDVEPAEFSTPTPEPDASLTDRQIEVLRCVAEGKSAKEAAFQLKVSPKTIEFHKSKIMGKLQLRTTAELTRYAMNMGIVE